MVFHATNETENAVNGSVVTCWVDLIGLNNAGELTTLTVHDAVFQNMEEGSLLLRVNTAAIVADGQDSVTLHAEFCGFEQDFTYNIVTQSTDSDSLAILVNLYTGVEKDYVPDNLTVSDQIYYLHDSGSTVNYLRDCVTNALESMILAAKEDGITLYECSGYRPYSMQERLYNNAVSLLGSDQQDTAKPGHSEHQTGLAVDLMWPSFTGGLTTDMKNSEEYEWLQENSYRYGFVLRYPEGCTDITGYLFEPWHYRYIGVELATEFHESGMSTLDEFLSVPRE